MNWRKVLLWLASYPLDRVRARIALRKMRQLPSSTLPEEMKRYYSLGVLAAARDHFIMMDRIADAALRGEIKTMQWRKRDDVPDGVD